MTDDDEIRSLSDGTMHRELIGEPTPRDAQQISYQRGYALGYRIGHETAKRELRDEVTLTVVAETLEGYQAAAVALVKRTERAHIALIVGVATMVTATIAVILS